MIRMYWDFDTCNCQILHSWDTVNDTFTLVEYTRTCSFHAPITDVNQRHNTVKDENKKKNDSHQLLMDNAPASMIQTMPSGSITLKKGVTINFEYTGTAPNRILTLTVSGVTLTQQQINKAQNVLDTKYGISQVNIVNTP